MIDIHLLREQPHLFNFSAERRGEEISTDQIIGLDSERRAVIAEADGLRSQRNVVSRRLGQTAERPRELIDEMREVGGRIKILEGRTRDLDAQLHEILLTVPNTLDSDVPDGRDETENVVVKNIGEIRSFSFEPRPHWELGEQLDIIDFSRGVRLSGSRFFVLKGQAARLQRALISWMIDLHVQEHAYEEVYLPYLVNRETAIGSGQLPKFNETMYHDDESDLWLVPTAEMPLTSLFRDEILPPGRLPMRFVAHTPCFRREKAAAGRDTRGMKRVHQFEKVEMYHFVEPSESESALDNLVADAEDVCVRLGLPYRVVRLCAGEVGFTSAQGYDIEVWAPGSGEWLEVSSCSNCRDFQARRAGIRYKSETGGSAHFVHTLNGSGLALPRVIIAILENYQQKDGSVEIPEVLRPYTGFDFIL